MYMYFKKLYISEVNKAKMFLRILRRKNTAFAMIVTVNIVSLIALWIYAFEMNSVSGGIEISLLSRQFLQQKNPVNYSKTNDSSLGIVIRDFRIQNFEILQRRAYMSKENVKKILEADNKPLTRTQYNHVYIFAAVARQHRENDSLKHVEGVAVNTWEVTTFSERRTFCCFLNEDGGISKRPVIRKSSFLNNTLTSVQILCKTLVGAPLPVVAVTLTYENDVCPLSAEFYVKTTFPQNCSEKYCLAICAKIAYGMVNPEILIEWLEYYRHMDVSRVVVFTYNLTVIAMDVLRFYEKERWVEVLPFDYPSKNSPAHHIGDKTIAGWSDEQLTVYDCHDRLRGYDYVGVVDLDEFLVPRRGNILGFLKSMSEQHPDAASFAFMTEIHAINQRQKMNPDHALIPQFVGHGKPLKDRNKVVHRPNFVEEGGIATHGIIPKPGYKRVVVLPQQATLKHYRQCRKEWLQDGTCFNQTIKTDKRIDDIFKQIEGRIASVKSVIFL